MDHADGLGNGIELVLDADDGEFLDVDAALLADFGDEVAVTHEGHFYEALVDGDGCGFDGMGVDTPGDDHALADLPGFEFDE